MSQEMRIKEIEESLQLSTKGKWDWTIGADGKCSVYGKTEQDSMADAELVAYGIANEDDAILIANAFNVLPDLLKAVHLLKAKMNPLTNNQATHDEALALLSRLSEARQLPGSESSPAMAG